MDTCLASAQPASSGTRTENRLEQLEAFAQRVVAMRNSPLRERVAVNNPNGGYRLILLELGRRTSTDV